MALLPSPRTPIELPVADRQLADTLIRQKARFVSLSHGQAPDGSCTALIKVLVTMYAADGAGFGPLLQGPGFAPYPVELLADNNCLVAFPSGEVLARRNGANQPDWQATIDSFGQDTMLQGDFFEFLRENVDVRIGDLIRLHITQADAPPSRFA